MLTIEEKEDVENIISLFKQADCFIIDSGALLSSFEAHNINIKSMRDNLAIEFYEVDAEGNHYSYEFSVEELLDARFQGHEVHITKQESDEVYRIALFNLIPKKLNIEK